MATKPELAVAADVNTADATTTTADPFDLASLRLRQDFTETAGVRKLLTTVPVRKPNSQDFVRTHSGPDFRVDVLTIDLKEDRDIYLVRPELAGELAGETVNVSLFTAISRQGVVFLWPVRIPPPDGKQLEWWRSQREAAELAMSRWVRVQANMALGAYNISEAVGVMSEPLWPDASFQDLLRIAFRNRLIDRVDHPVIRRLRGLA